MGAKLPYTPRGKIRAAVRLVWLRSRERMNALKRDEYTCQCCGRKQSKAKGREFAVEVHHKAGRIANWEGLIDAFYEHILCDPEDLETLCKACHSERGQE